MKSIETTGKTVDEAIENALKELNITKDMVDIDIIEQGSKGLFNLFGAKPFRIKATIRDIQMDQSKNDIDNNGTNSEVVIEFLKSIFDSMKIEAEVEVTEAKDELHVNIIGEDVGVIIGYRGETLDAIQYLLSLVVNKKHDSQYKRVILDSQNYRKKRQETLRRVADKTANKVLKSRRAYKLEPMNAYERRIIHAALQENNQIYTYSEGEDPFRRIVVDIKRDK
jgi:spoIIIJ-associated protein